MGVDDFLERMDAKEASRPVWNKAWRRIRWAWESFHYRFVMLNTQRIGNRLRHGYWGPDQDAFSFDSCLARHALPRLREMRRTLSGYPSQLMARFPNDSREENDASFARWQSMIDDMLYWLEQVAEGNTVHYPEPDHRYRRGKYYFFRYFESLWT